MRLPTGQECSACGAANSMTGLIRTGNHCKACGVRFEYTGRYYVMLFVCAMMGSFGGNLVRDLFDISGILMTAAILLPTVWALFTAAWYLVPGLIVARSGSGDEEA